VASSLWGGRQWPHPVRPPWLEQLWCGWICRGGQPHCAVTPRISECVVPQDPALRLREARHCCRSLDSLAPSRSGPLTFIHQQALRCHKEECEEAERRDARPRRATQISQYQRLEGI
jgi:hypothetical protein